MTNLNSPLPYADENETVPADEAANIQRVIAALEVLLSRSQARSGQFRADVHVKTHGYAQGEFRVLPNLPAELAQGLFEHDRMYQAVVRFSNAASHAQSDAIPDGRGLAIKVLDVHGDLVLADDQRGPTQDFVMINHPVFFARNVQDYLRLEQVLVQADDNSLAALQGALTGGDWNPLQWHWREMLTVARIAGQLPAHPASNTYFSMAPIRFGNYVAKYRARPAGDRHDSYLELVQRLGSHADALRLALEETLHTQQVLFEFQVQLRTSERTMPIEDATVEWPESESPYRTVAHLLLPRQEIAPLRQQAAYQSLAFNVWHALAAHRPLGGINRVRRRAYEVSSAWRRQRAALQASESPSADSLPLEL
jgi:catalase